MLPLIDKPLIQYGVEEVVRSGITNIVIVTGRGKTAIEDHFDVSFELEHALAAKGKKDPLNLVHGISSGFEVCYVRQKEALGLGHAISRSRQIVRNRSTTRRGGHWNRLNELRKRPSRPISMKRE